jgi:hypothetical protein
VLVRQFADLAAVIGAGPRFVVLLVARFYLPEFTE